MFLIQLRPLEPYMTAYLTGPNGNVSLYEVSIIVLTTLRVKHTFVFFLL